MNPRHDDDEGDDDDDDDDVDDDVVDDDSFSPALPADDGGDDDDDDSGDDIEEDPAVRDKHKRLERNKDKDSASRNDVGYWASTPLISPNKQNVWNP